MRIVSYQESCGVVTFKQDCYFPVDSDMTFHKGTVCFRLIPEKKKSKTMGGRGAEEVTSLHIKKRLGTIKRG